MFYSHEILTSRKYGVATVWLVATLGAKSSTKKVTKKAINSVDIRKACETIIEPEAPMALRLQSNLLYGVSKVYNQQWEYLLADVNAAHLQIRTLLKTARSDGLDPNAGKANPDQLILMDDPAFNPDIALPDLGFDLDRALTPQADTQRSSQSMLSIRGRARSGSVSSHYATSVLGLDIASSSGGGASYQLPAHHLFSDSKNSKQAGGYAHEEEELVLQDDDIFDFDAEGNIRDIPESEREARRAASVAPQHRLGSDSAASGRVRKDHEEAQAGRIIPVLDADGDFDMPRYGEEVYDMGLPDDAEPFPVMTGALGGDDNPVHLSDPEQPPSSPEREEEEPSSDSVTAPLRKRKQQPKKPRFMKLDDSTMVRNSELLVWQAEYLHNMSAQSLANTNKKNTQQSKPNAFRYVYGSGINGIGEGVGSAKFVSPLAMFSGELLRAKLSGKSLTKAKAKGRSGKKRAHEADAEEEESPKRIRSDEIGRGVQDDDNAFNLPDDDPFMDNNNNDQDHEADVSIELERGRDAASALPDYPSSAAMPWNVSASLHSHQRGHSSSIQRGRLGSQGLGPSRRLTSASPLIGRGSALPDDLNNTMGLDDDEMVMYGRSDNERSSSQIPGLGFGAMGLKTSTQIGMEEEEFEMFGAAAAVDTQTAADSQWVRSALDSEANNFLEYVKNTIEEKSRDELDLDLDDAEGGNGGEKSVSFEELFDPERNSCMVAAQAFYHVLCLATKGRVWVEQDTGVEGLMPWGEIRIGVKSG